MAGIEPVNPSGVERAFTTCLLHCHLRTLGNSDRVHFRVLLQQFIPPGRRINNSQKIIQIGINLERGPWNMEQSSSSCSNSETVPERKRKLFFFPPHSACSQFFWLYQRIPPWDTDLQNRRSFTKSRFSRNHTSVPSLTFL